MPIWLMLLLAVPASHAADDHGNYAVWGMGSKSCHTYNQVSAQGETGDYRNYVMGYLTAYNAVAQDTYRIEGNMNIDEIMTWIHDYCEVKPMNGFEQALSDFTVEHASTRIQRAPSRSGR